MKTSMTTNKHKQLINIFASTFTIFLLFIGWILLSNLKNNHLIYPTLTQIFEEFCNIFQKEPISKFSSSLYRLIVSIVLSFVIAMIILALYLIKKWTFGFFSPIIKIMRSVPFVSFSIFVLLIFGNEYSPYIITTLVTIPLVVEGLKSGLDQIDRNLTDDLALLNVGFFKKIYLVYLPILFPTIITLILQTFGLGFKVMIMGEYFSQTPNSIGKELYNAKSNLDMDILIAWTIMIVIITGIVEFLVNYLKNKHNYLIN